MKRWIFLFLTSYCAIAYLQPLTFQEALDAIANRNIDLKKQVELSEAGRLRNIKDRLRLLPELSASIAKSGGEAIGTPWYSSFSYSLNASMNIFKFGADLAAIRAASKENEAQRAIILQRAIEEESRAISTIIDVIQNEQIYKVVEALSDVREKVSSFAKHRYNKGLLPKEEYDKALIDYYGAQARKADAETAATQSKGKLEALLGGSDISLEWPWEDPIKQNQLKIEPDAPSLENRPDWQAARLTKEAVGLRTRQRWGEWLPSLDLQLSYGHLYNFPSNQSGQQWMGALQLTVPLFDRLSGYNEYQAQVHLSQIAELELEKIRRTSTSEWQIVKKNLSTTLKAARTRNEILRTARQLYDETLLKFKQGQASVDTLVLDEERLHDSRLSSIRGYATAHLTLAKYCHTKGLLIKSCEEISHFLSPQKNSVLNNKPSGQPASAATITP